MGENPSIQALAEAVGCEGYLSFFQLAEKLAGEQRLIHTLPQYRGDNLLLLNQLVNGEVTPSKPLINAVVNQREVKTAEEIADMQKGMEITQAVHLHAMKMTQPGLLEKEVIAEIQRLVFLEGSEFAYSPIFSVDGHILHNHHYHNVMQHGQLVLNDSGVYSPNRYATDITRTFPVSGQFTTQQREIYEIVLTMQAEALATIKAGAVYQASHLAAARAELEGLCQLGLVKGDIDEALHQGAYGLFFPHGLGHLIGLDVHDMEGLGEDIVGYDNTIHRSNQFGLSALRLGKPLRENMLITVEPGLYFVERLIKQWQSENKLKECICYDKLRPYLSFGGVRIEDNVQITQSSFINLSAEIPKSASDIESACL